MKLCLKILAIVIVAASMYSLISCAAPATFNYQSVKLNLTYTPCAANCPAIYFNPAMPQAMVTPGPNNSGCVNIFATVTNAPANITYTLYPTPSLIIPTLPSGTSTTIGTGSGQIPEQASPVGTVNYATGTTNFFCPPSKVPVYTGAALQQAQSLGIPQGDVLLVAGVPSDPSVPSSSCVLPTSPGCAIFTQLLQIYNSVGSTGPPTVTLFPSTISGNTNSAVTVPRNTTFQFNGFAVGAPPCLSVTACSVPPCLPNVTCALLPCTTAPCTVFGAVFPLLTTDNAIVWTVGTSQSTATACTVASLCPEGTISATGLYTAPATVPSSPPVVVATSHLVGTIYQDAYVTVN